MRKKTKSGIKTTADVSDHAKTHEPSRKRKSNAEKQRDYRLRKKKKIQESQCLATQKDINIGTDPGNSGTIKNVPNTRQALRRKKKSNAEKQREYRQRLKIKKKLSGVPESVQKRKRKITNNDEVKSRNAAYAKAYRYKKKIQKLSNIETETRSQESQTLVSQESQTLVSQEAQTLVSQEAQTLVSQEPIQTDTVTQSDTSSIVEAIEETVEDLQRPIEIQVSFSDTPNNITNQYELTVEAITDHEGIEIDWTAVKCKIERKIQEELMNEMIESKPVIDTIQNDVAQNNTSGDQIRNKYKDYAEYIAAQMLIHQFTSPRNNAVNICDTLRGRNNKKSAEEVQDRSRQISQNSEDGVNDNGDEDAPPFEQSMETYPEYSVNNMVNVEDHKRYQLPSFEEDTKSIKRHCTEIEDEYDAIGINVAAKLRNLPSNMRILAEKLINDALYQAQMNGLNSSSVITTTDPFNQVII